MGYHGTPSNSFKTSTSHTFCIASPPHQFETSTFVPSAPGTSPNWNLMIDCSLFVCSKQLQPSLLAGFCNFMFTDTGSKVCWRLGFFNCKHYGSTALVTPLQAPVVPSCSRSGGSRSSSGEWAKRHVVDEHRPLHPKSHQASDFGKKNNDSDMHQNIMVPSMLSVYYYHFEPDPAARIMK